MRKTLTLGLWIALVLSAAGAPAAETVPAIEAVQHVGQTVTVCRPVAGVARFERLQGEPTFLNFDRPHPDQSFTVVIWGIDARRFAQPPHRMFAGKEICVTGAIEIYKGKPQIVVRDPAQITVVAPLFDGDRFTPEERILLKALLAELGLGADPGDGIWDGAADEALSSFRTQVDLTDEAQPGPRTLRALAEAVDRLDAEARGRILKLLLLNLAQREESCRR